MRKTHKPFFLIVNVHTGIAYHRETELERALEIVNKLNKANGYRYRVEKCYN